ncbi:unnamed protein product [Symbiodinium necroappetens]|uniref:Uncharacterized protein n=1 Tax=Symbiodinium necroappetens TaxID=1628268 RepID=A0A812X2Z6_9DINO|nr:unnamed protein product [Symbiodinium necroappetens]
MKHGMHGMDPIGGSGGVPVHHIHAIQPEAMPLKLPQGEKLPLTRGQDWRWVAGSLAACVVVALILYELSLRFPRQPQLQAEPKSRPPEGVDFLEQLQQAKEEVETDFSLLDVEREFQKKYTDKARPLLCSACKIAAERIGLELDARNATEQPDPSTMLNATKEAVLAACQALPSPLVVVEGEGKASFEEVHDSDHRHLTGVELRRAEVAQRSVDRLCRVLLAEAKLDMLQLMMQHKVPHTRFHGQVLSDNWERWLCARRSRLCKYSEVIDDDEDEEGEL